MAAHPYILARTLGEAHAFARGPLGLVHGTYRVINSPGTIKSVRNVDLILAPGWEKRFDYFSMKGAIRWTHMNVVDRTQAEEPDVTDGLEPAGIQLTLVSDDEADAFVAGDLRALEAMLEPAGWEPPETLSANQVLALAASPDALGSDVLADETARRRSRCKICSTLHFKDESCPSETIPGV